MTHSLKHEEVIYRAGIQETERELREASRVFLQETSHKKEIYSLSLQLRQRENSLERQGERACVCVGKERE